MAAHQKQHDLKFCQSATISTHITPVLHPKCAPLTESK